MPTPNQIKDHINGLVGFLIEAGLAEDQGFAFQRSTSGGLIEVTFQNANEVSIALKDRTYEEIYQHILEARAYTAKLPDGAMLQMMYQFADNVLRLHRLAFFPSPFLETFQNDPDPYLNDEVYADIVAKNVVSFPIRFDYDSDDRIHRELEHPKSHMTLGQYKNCRIPVTAPLTPSQFVDFILRNFYHTAFRKYADKLPVHDIGLFDDTILQSEQRVIHVVIPR